MKTIALSRHGDRLSPVFDVAPDLLLVELDDGGARARRRPATLSRAYPWARADELRALGVDVLLCGAVSRSCELALVARGVDVRGFLCGAVEDVLAAYVAGRLGEAGLEMPGCCGRRRRFGGGRQAGGGEAAEGRGRCGRGGQGRSRGGGGQGHGGGRRRAGS